MFVQKNQSHIINTNEETSNINTRNTSKTLIASLLSDMWRVSKYALNRSIAIKLFQLYSNLGFRKIHIDSNMYDLEWRGPIYLLHCILCFPGATLQVLILVTSIGSFATAKWIIAIWDNRRSFFYTWYYWTTRRFYTSSVKIEFCILGSPYFVFDSCPLILNLSRYMSKLHHDENEQNNNHILTCFNRSQKKVQKCQVLRQKWSFLTWVFECSEQHQKALNSLKSQVFLWTILIYNLHM